MNKSRFSLLLTVALFVAPAFVIAEDAVATEPTTEITTAAESTNTASEVAPEAAPETTEVVVSNEAKAGIFAALTAFVAARRANVNTGLDKVASFTFNPVLRKLASFNCLQGGKFENNIPTMNRVLVATTAAALVFAAYKAYVAQQDANDDFDADFDADNN